MKDISTNGLYNYDSLVGDPGAETEQTRYERERFWRRLGKKVRNGERIKQHNQ